MATSICDLLDIAGLCLSLERVDYKQKKATCICDLLDIAWLCLFPKRLDTNQKGHLGK
jgi:hypothetical protein